MESRPRGSDAGLAAHRRSSRCARCRAGIAALLVIAAFTGCTYSVAGNLPAPIEPPKPSFQPSVEYTVSDFHFALGGGDMTPSIFDGKQLSEEIMESWHERGYVRAEQYVADGEFSGGADYHLTMHGSQRGETSWTMQIINALTLSLVPYTITQCYDFHYVLDDRQSGLQYYASVQAWDTTWVEPILILALPFASRGHLTTMERVGDDLYDQFRRQGAFGAESLAATLGSKEAPKPH